MPTPTPGAVAGEQGDAAQQPTPGTSGAQDKSPDFQKAIDAIVARERKSAEAEIQARDAKIAELTALVPKPRPTVDVDPVYIESVRKPLVDENAALKGELDRLNGSLLKADLTGVIKPMAADGAESDILDALLPRVKRTATGVEVLDAEGRPRYGRNGPMTVQEAALELAASKPYLFAAKVRSGLGGGGTPAQSGSAMTVEGIKAQIAEAEGKLDFAKAGLLKSQLLKVTQQQKPRR